MNAIPPTSRRRERLLHLLPLLLALAFCLPALQALWQPGLQHTDDGMHHLFRLFNLDLALRAGHPGARWLADEGFGYGFPVLNFYGPLNYWFGLLFNLVAPGFVTTLELTMAAGLLLSVAAMYRFARDLVGPWGGGVAAAAVSCQTHAAARHRKLAITATALGDGPGSCRSPRIVVYFLASLPKGLLDSLKRLIATMASPLFVQLHFLSDRRSMIVQHCRWRGVSDSWLPVGVLKCDGNLLSPDSTGVKSA